MPTVDLRELELLWSAALVMNLYLWHCKGRSAGKGRSAQRKSQLVIMSCEYEWAVNVHCPTKPELSLLTKQIDLLPVLLVGMFVCLFWYIWFFLVEGSKLGNPDKKRTVEGHYWNRVPHHTLCINCSANQHGFFRCTVKLCFPRLPLQDSRLSCKAVISQAVILFEVREWVSGLCVYTVDYSVYLKKTEQNYFGLAICALFPVLE